MILIVIEDCWIGVWILFIGIMVLMYNKIKMMIYILMNFSVFLFYLFNWCRIGSLVKVVKIEFVRWSIMWVVKNKIVNVIIW